MSAVTKFYLITFRSRIRSLILMRVWILKSATVQTHNCSDCVYVCKYYLHCSWVYEDLKNAVICYVKHMLQQSVFQFCGVFHCLSFDKNGRSVHINHHMNANQADLHCAGFGAILKSSVGKEREKRREMEWALSCWKATNPLQLWKTFSSAKEWARDSWGKCRR